MVRTSDRSILCSLCTVLGSHISNCRFVLLVRYNDEIQCAAARVVQGLHENALAKTNGASASFHTMHVRRGDFTTSYQKGSNAVTADDIYQTVKDELEDGSIVYVATDETDKSFFKPLGQHYDIKFLDDFTTELNPKGFRQVNPNVYGMIDQLVVSAEVVLVSNGASSLFVPYSQCGFALCA
jgi:GDP-fucose protein O-fucosyltransferase